MRKKLKGKGMRIINTSKNSVLAHSCEAADSFLARFFGLMGKSCLHAGGGLLLTPCNSIHMFFMRFPLDVVFIDKNNTVVYLIENIKPWRVSPIVKQARSVIELPLGTISASGTEVGDRLVFNGYHSLRPACRI